MKLIDATERQMAAWKTTAVESPDRFEDPAEEPPFALSVGDAEPALSFV